MTLTQTKKEILESYDKSFKPLWIEARGYTGLKSPKYIGGGYMEVTEDMKAFLSEALDEYAKAVVEELKVDPYQLAEEFEEKMTAVTFGTAIHGMGNVHLFAGLIEDKLNRKRNEVIESLPVVKNKKLLNKKDFMKRVKSMIED